MLKSLPWMQPCTARNDPQQISNGAWVFKPCQGYRSRVCAFMKGSPWRYKFVKMRSSSLRPPQEVLPGGGGVGGGGEAAAPAEKARRALHRGKGGRFYQPQDAEWTVTLRWMRTLSAIC